jgi:metal-responsive CopG/Arc/MetJ family transcriptional regulator
MTREESQVRKVKTWSITLPPEMAQELEEVMKEEKRGKSELVREALRRYMDDVRWRKIYRYGELKAQETGISEADVVDIVHERRREKELA